MFWVIISAILLLIFRNEIVSYFTSDEERKKIMMMWLVLGTAFFVLIFGSIKVYISELDKKSTVVVEQVVTPEKPKDENTKKPKVSAIPSDLVVPDGYEIIPLKVVKNYYICPICERQVSSSAFHNVDRKVIVLKNGKKLTFWLNSKEYNNWASIEQGDICSYIRKVDEHGVLIKDIVLPVAPEFVCFDTKKGTVSYRN